MTRGAEKRRSPRTRTDSVLEIYNESGHLIVGVGRLVDYSAVGACFTSNKKLIVGERVRAKMRLISQSVAEVPAKVVWARPKGNTIVYGIEFEAD